LSVEIFLQNLTEHAVFVKLKHSILCILIMIDPRETSLNLNEQNLRTLPESITDLTDLACLYLENNHLTSLPNRIGNLTNLHYLNIGGNQIDRLPESIINLSKLQGLWLVGNPLKDFSILRKLPSLQFVRFIGNGYFYRRYWADFDEWHPQWLLDREEEKKRIFQIESKQNYFDET
jgi:Leucine-rich repeat (LRR) protein